MPLLWLSLFLFISKVSLLFIKYSRLTGNPAIPRFLDTRHQPRLQHLNAITIPASIIYPERRLSLTSHYRMHLYHFYH